MYTVLEETDYYCFDHTAEGIAWRHFMPPLRLQATKKQSMEKKVSTVIFSQQEGLS